MSFQDAFAGGNQIAARDGGNPLGDGTYPELEIGEIKVIDGHFGKRFIAALEVTQEGVGVGATPVGSSGDFSAKIDGEHRKMGIGDVKAFVMKALGIAKHEEATFDFEGIMPRVFGAEQILRGRKIAATKWMRDTRNIDAATGRPRQVAQYRFETIEGQAPVPVRGAAPASPPPLPGVPVPPLPTAPAFPPPGWIAHPAAPGYFYKGTEVLTEAALRARGG